MAGGVATLTAVGHTPTVGDSVTVTTPVTARTFSYAASSVATTSGVVAANVATLTATTPLHGLAVGNVVTVNYTNGGGRQRTSTARTRSRP